MVVPRCLKRPPALFPSKSQPLDIEAEKPDSLIHCFGRPSGDYTSLLVGFYATILPYANQRRYVG